MAQSIAPGVRLEDCSIRASAGSVTELLFELSGDGRDLTGTLPFRQTFARGLCEMPDLMITVRGMIAADWTTVELQ